MKLYTLLIEQVWHNGWNPKADEKKGKFLLSTQLTCEVYWHKLLLSISTTLIEPNLVQITLLQKMFLNYGASKPDNKIWRVSRSGCDTHENSQLVAAKPTSQTAQSQKPKEAAVTYRWRERTLEAAGPREGMAVSSLLFSRLQEREINCWSKQPTTKREQERPRYFFIESPWLSRNIDILAEASISGGSPGSLWQSHLNLPTQPFKRRATITDPTVSSLQKQGFFFPFHPLP